MDSPLTVIDYDAIIAYWMEDYIHNEETNLLVLDEEPSHETE